MGGAPGAGNGGTGAEAAADQGGTAMNDDGGTGPDASGGMGAGGLLGGAGAPERRPGSAAARGRALLAPA